MTKKKLFIFLYTLSILIISGFSNYPEVEIISSPTNTENTILSINGWLGTTSKIEVNNNILESSYTFTNQNITSISLSSTIDQAEINIGVGETFNFVNNAQSAVSYKIIILQGNQLLFSSDISPSQISQNFKFDTIGTYIISNENTGISKTISVNYKNQQKNIQIPLSMLSEGINTIKTTTKTTIGEEIQSENSFSFDKFQNSITFDGLTVSKTSSITGKISAENLNNDFYYIINQEGFVPNCGNYVSNKLDVTANGDEITIRNLQERDNTIRIISTDAACSNINGEYRFEVLVDRVAPTLNLVEAFYGRTGTQNSGEYEPEIFDSNEVYTNTDEITLLYDSRDITKIDYIINGREEGLLIDTQQIEKISQIESFFVESDGSKLEITLRPYSEYTQSYITWSYDRIEDREVKVRNGEIKLSLDLKDERLFDLTFFEGDGPDVQQEEIRIFDLAYQGVGELKTADSLNDNSLYEIKLNLIDGQNNITLLAYDQSGNIKKEIKTIFIDTEDPNLVDKNDFDPKPGSSVHFPIQKLKGQVNKEDMYIEVFTIPEGERVIDFEDEDGRTKTLSCSTYKESVIRGIDNLNRERRSSTAINLQEIQFDLSLQSLLLNKESTRSDSEGNFEVYIGLEEESFTQSDLNDVNDRTIDKTTSRNKICIIMADKYGNIDVEELSYTLDTGNSLWKEAEITTTPNSIYAAEIEQIGDRRSGSGKVQFSMIARFQYLGSGRVEDISTFRISLDSGSDNDRFQGRGNILQSGVNYVFDKTTNELIVYVPIEISPLGEDPLEYPDEIKFNLKATINYNLEDKEIPVDTANPIYFETLINIERPLDHTKWLTPSTIQSGLEFINRTIKFTEKATNVMKYASFGSTFLCAGYKFVHTACLATAEGNQEKISECDEKFFNVCDRISGLESPPACGLNGQDDDGFVDLNSGVDFNGKLSDNDFKDGLEFYEEGQVAGRFTDLRIRETDKCGEGQVEVSGEIKKFKERTSSFTGSVSTVESEGFVNDICVPVKKQGNEITSINLQKAGNLCYSSGAPNYDNTKCSLSLYGLGNIKEGTPGKDPSISILSSVQCGAVVDTYQHLQVMLRVQTGIQKCLEQAKIGEIQGGYCERLVGQAVCDIATNVVLPELIQNSQSSGSINKDGTRVGETLSSALSNVEVSNRAYKERYDGSTAGRLGITTDQIVNKACLGALTGDWSVLENNILSTIEDAEVEPVFGPPVAESRLQGYNPITGDIAIRYQFTYAAVSGGQSINTEYQFICNPAAPNGDFCPENTIVYSSEQGTDFKKRTLTVRRDGVVQDNIVVTENEGRYWYNQIELTHKYDVGTEKRENKQVFNIAHKSEMFGQCNWNGGLFGTGTSDESSINGQEVLPVGGISCGTIFGKESLLPSYEIDKSKTKVLPSKQSTFYPGNSIYLDTILSSRGTSENEELALAYMATCPSNGEDLIYLGNKIAGNTFLAPQVKSLDGIKGDINQIQISVPLFEEINEIGTGEDSYSININSLNSKSNYLFAYTKSGTETGVGFIDKIIVNEKYSLESSALNFGLVKQNLIINGIGENSYNELSIENLRIKLNQEYPKKNIKIEEISILFKEKPLDVIYFLGDKSQSEGNEIASITQGLNVIAGGRLSTGTCTLYVRLLPRIQANSLTKENFKTYTPISQEGDTDDLVIDPRLETSNTIFEKSFSLKSTPNSESTNDHFVDIIFPRENSIIQLSGEGEGISIKSLYQNSQNKETDISRIEVSISLNQFGKIAELETSNLITEMVIPYTDVNKLQTALSNLENSESSLFQSGVNILDATMSYKITLPDGKEVIDTIEFKIIKGESSTPGPGSSTPGPGDS